MYIVIDREVEHWVQLKAYNIKDIYEISNYGNIRKCFGSKSIPIFISKDGYKRVNLKTNEGIRTTFLIHRLVAFMFVKGFDPKKGKVLVNHLDSDRAHSYYENLEWVTYSENIKHGYDHGRILKYGISKPKHKTFDDNIIHSICGYLESGFSPSVIYKKLNTTDYNEKSIKDLITRLKRKESSIYNDITKYYNIPNVTPQKELDDITVHKICELLSNGYSSNDIINILNLPLDQKQKYQKNICDIRNRKTFVSISSKYVFPISIYGRQSIYPVPSIIEICEHLQKGIKVPVITNYIITKYNICNTYNLVRDFIYDIKRRRIHTDISKFYIW